MRNGDNPSFFSLRLQEQQLTVASERHQMSTLVML